MARGKAFVEVLDEVLAGYGPGEDATPRRIAGIATPSIFCFESRDMLRGASGSTWMSASVPAPAPTSGPVRTRRTLSPRQRDAFAAFVQLGAPISDDFTDAELRSSFRSLALRYHPDRHPGSDDTERAHLSVRFAELHDAYESLKSVPVCRN